MDAVLAKHKSDVRIELKNKAKGEFLLTFEPLRVDTGKKGPQGWNVDTFRTAIAQLLPKA